MSIEVTSTIEGEDIFSEIEDDVRQAAEEVATDQGFIPTDEVDELIQAEVGEAFSIKSKGMADAIANAIAAKLAEQLRPLVRGTLSKVGSDD